MVPPGSVSSVGTSQACPSPPTPFLDDIVLCFLPPALLTSNMTGGGVGVAAKAPVPQQRTSVVQPQVCQAVWAWARWWQLLFARPREVGQGVLWDLQAEVKLRVNVWNQKSVRGGPAAPPPRHVLPSAHPWGTACNRAASLLCPTVSPGEAPNRSAEWGKERAQGKLQPCPGVMVRAASGSWGPSCPSLCFPH